jgi:hypothetical protein
MGSSISESEPPRAIVDNPKEEESKARPAGPSRIEKQKEAPTAHRLDTVKIETVDDFIINS